MKPKIFKKEGLYYYAADIGKKDEPILVYTYKLEEDGDLRLRGDVAYYPINKESRKKIAEIKKMVRTYKE